MKKIVVIGVCLMLIFTASSIIEKGKALNEPFPVYGYIKDSSGSYLPSGINVVIKDLSKGSQIIATTNSNGFYQADLFNLPNCENGDNIEVYCSYNNEDNSKTFILDTHASTSQNVSFFLVGYPSVSTLGADIIGNLVKLSGNLIELKDSSCQVWFEYGETTSYGHSTTKQTKYSSCTFSTTISGLKPDKTYHFRAVAKNSRKISYGNDITFHTPPVNPVVTTNSATGVGYNSATLNGYLNNVGAASCQVWFEYGETTSYGHSTTKQTKYSSCTFSTTISGLEVNKTYHFRAVAKNSNGTAMGNDITFTTHIMSPSVSTSNANNVTSSSAKLNGNLIDLGGAASCQVWFEYGETTSYGHSTAIISLNSASSFSMDISGLDAGKTYHFRAVAQNSNGISYGNDITFLTGYKNPLTETESIDYAVILKGNLTDMGGDSQCYVYFEYWEKNGSKLSTDKKIMNKKGEFNEILSIEGLKENTTYYYRAVVENSNGISYGRNLTFRTISLPAMPSIATMNANLSKGNVSLNANLSSMGDSSFCYLWFEYWSNKRFTTSVLLINKTGLYNVNISGLESGKYYYQAVAVGSNGRISYGGIKNFTIPAKENHKPNITIISPVNGSITDVSISLMANVYDEDGDLMNVTFYWGNGSKIYSLNTKNGTISVAVHLEYGTNYNWKVVANDSRVESIVFHHFSTIEKIIANFTHSFIFENETAYFNDTSIGMIQQWLWQFGDGTTSHEKNPTHIYKKAGCYTVNLTVIDVYGKQFSIEKSIHVWKRGDVNMDGKINALDVTSLEIIIANNSMAAPPPADANGDNVVDEQDVNRIIEMIVGK